MRIAYIIDSLSYRGGAERIITEKANYLAELDGYDVTIIVCYGFSEPAPIVYHISDKVRQISLNVRYHSQYQYRYPRRLLVKWQLNRQLQHSLKEAVESVNPDIIIVPGYNLADTVCRLPVKAAKIVESHEARPFTKSGQLYSHSALSRLFMHIYRAFYLHTVERRADVVVTLTQGDAWEWRKARRVEVIPNYSFMNVTGISDGSSKRAIAVGRLDWQKGFDRLIEVWQLVNRRHPDWHLDIYGSGVLESELRKAIADAQPCNADIHPFTPDISACYAESSVYLMTSRFEGFGLVLLEAMKHGLPCVAFDCRYGPADIIADGRSGYIVADGDIKSFADRVCTIIENPQTWKSMSAEGIKRAEAYNLDAIMNQWTALFTTLRP